METLTKKKGMEMLPLIWTVFLSYDKDFWANPFTDRKLRFRCIFEKISGIGEGLRVYFHLSDNESFSSIPSGSIYLFGAFNQVTVYQVRSLGNLREMTSEEKANFLKLMEQRLSGKKLKDKLAVAMSFDDCREASSLLRSGKFYCFEPVDYAFHTFQRG